MSYDFETPFQKRILAAAWDDEKFIKENEAVLRPEYFGDEILAATCEVLVGYTKREGRVPDLAAVLEELKAHVAPGRTYEEYAKVARLINKKRGNPNADYYKKQAVDFARKSALTQAIAESHTLVSAGELDAVEALIRNALNTGGKAGGEAYDLLAKSEERSKAEYQNVSVARPGGIPSGFGPLDQETKGGIGPGEVGCIMGLPGSGKSVTLTSIGASVILTKPVNVLHITLENSLMETSARYDARLYGKTIKEIRSAPETFQKAMRKLQEKLKAKLLIRYYPEGTLTPSMLEAAIEATLPRPNLVIVDYATCMRPPNKREEKRHEYADIFKGLRGVAGRTQLPIWTAHQANRPGMGARVLDMDNIEECFAINGIIDLGVSVNVDEMRPAEATLFVMKNRLGRKGFEIKCEFDGSLSKIACLQDEV